MPKTFDNLKFQSTEFGLVGKSEVDPGSAEVADDILPAVNTASRTDAGFASNAAERLDRLSRTQVGTDELLLNGEVPINSPNAQINATRLSLSRNRVAEQQIEEQRKAFVAAYPG